MNGFTYYEPISRKVININGKDKLINEIGHIALMCPTCFHMIKIQISHHRYIGEVFNKINDFTANTIYHGECPNCKEVGKFEVIDVNIADTIAVLNSKGYYTAFCCEGHIEPDFYDGTEGFSRPYIYFYFWDDYSILQTHPLPLTWRMEPTDEKANIFVIEDSITGRIPKSFEDDQDLIRWIKTNWINRKERLLDIYKWAVSLPDKDINKKDFQRKIIDKCGDAILEMNSGRFIDIDNSKLDKLSKESPKDDY